MDFTSVSQQSGGAPSAGGLIEHACLRVQIHDPLTGNMWVPRVRISKKRFSALSVESGFIKYLSGLAMADAVWCRGSPGPGPGLGPGPAAMASSTPQFRVFDGVEFILLARCRQASPVLATAFVRYSIECDHLLQFNVGRKINALSDFDGGNYVEIMADSSAAEGGQQAAPALPAGFRLRELAITENLTIEISSPSFVYFNIRTAKSFVGPVEISDVAAGWVKTENRLPRPYQEKFILL